MSTLRSLSAWRVLGCALLGLWVLAANAGATDPQPGTPEAAAEGERILLGMSDTIAKAATLSFKTTEVLEGVQPGGEKRALHFARKVSVHRPDRLHFELHGLLGTQLEVAAFYDGSTLTLRGDVHRVWAQAEVPATIDAMLDDVATRFALPVPVGDVLYSSPHDAILGTTASGGLVGRETLDGVACFVLAYGDEFVGVQLWIPVSGQSLPRRLQLAYKQIEGIPTAQMDFRNWNLAATAPAALFSFAPPAEYRRVEVDEFVSGLLSGGAAVAPPPAPPAATGVESQ